MKHHVQDYLSYTVYITISLVVSKERNQTTLNTMKTSRSKSGEEEVNLLWETKNSPIGK